MKGDDPMPGRDDIDTGHLGMRLAARALARAGLVHAYGHCSLRLDRARFLVSPAKPLGLVAPGEPGVIVGIDGPWPEGVLGEVRIHREIYRRRDDIGGICRVMPNSVMSLSVLARTPRPRHGFGAYFAPAPPLWDDPQLLRADAPAARLAETLGRASAVVMRGNGAVVAAPSLEEAVVLAWYLEDAARVELAVLAVGGGDAPVMTEAEAGARATRAGLIIERMWDYLTAGDPERPDLPPST